MGFEMVTFESKRKNATGVVESCISRMSQTDDPENRGIAVFDVDENDPEDIRNAFELAQKNQVMVAISNPQFEVWLLMHFQNIPDEFIKEDIERKLKGHMPLYSKSADLSGLRPNISCAMERGYSKFREHGCDSVLANCPSTNMHCIVKRIVSRELDW
jgi:hypothetical protein